MKNASDSELIEWVRMRFEPLERGEAPLPYTRMATRLRRNRRTLEEGIREAFRRGLVRINTQWARVQQQTTKEFDSSLRTAYGIHEEPIIIQDPEESTPRGREAPYQRELYALLGAATAQYLATHRQFTFQSGTTLGLGSGRGVFFTVHSLRQLTPAERFAERVTVGALTGMIGDLDDKQHERGMLMLDADTLVSWSACCFGDGTQLRFVSHRLATTSPGEARQALKYTWLSEDNWIAPQRAVLGVGVLAPGHRFYLSAGQAVQRLLRPFADELEYLSRFADSCYEATHHRPIGDVANQLFIIEPEKRLTQLERNRDKLQKSIDLLNSRLVSSKMKQLREINHVHLVAAGTEKARAIYQVLKESNLRIATLTTTASCAERLVAWIPK